MKQVKVKTQVNDYRYVENREIKHKEHFTSGNLPYLFPMKIAPICDCCKVVGGLSEYTWMVLFGSIDGYMTVDALVCADCFYLFEDYTENNTIDSSINLTESQIAFLKQYYDTITIDSIKDASHTPEWDEKLRAFMQYTHDEMTDNGLSEKEYDNHKGYIRYLARNVFRDIQECGKEYIGWEEIRSIEPLFSAIYMPLAESNASDPDTSSHTFLSNLGISPTKYNIKILNILITKRMQGILAYLSRKE